MTRNFLFLLILALHLDKWYQIFASACWRRAHLFWKRVKERQQVRWCIYTLFYMRSDQSTGFNNNYIKICLLMVLFAVSGRLWWSDESPDCSKVFVFKMIMFFFFLLISAGPLSWTKTKHKKYSTLFGSIELVLVQPVIIQQLTETSLSQQIYSITQ